MPNGKLLFYKNELFKNNSAIITKSDTKLVNNYIISGSFTSSSSLKHEVNLPSALNSIYYMTIIISNDIYQGDVQYGFDNDMISLSSNNQYIVLYNMNNIWHILTGISSSAPHCSTFQPTNQTKLYIYPKSYVELTYEYHIYGFQIIA